MSMRTDEHDGSELLPMRTLQTECDNCRDIVENMRKRSIGGWPWVVIAIRCMVCGTTWGRQ
jgi:hypothetical protein